MRGDAQSKKPTHGSASVARGRTLSAFGLLQAKFASANDQFTRLFRKVSTNFGRMLR